MMKRWGSLLVIFILLLVVTSPLWVWWLKPRSPWQVRVLDYTAPHPNYREHDSLFWIYNHLKVYPPGEDRRFKPDLDYIGYYPELSNYEQKRFTTRRLKRDDLVGVDMLYISDVYGVYIMDYEGYHGREWVAHLDYSTLIFGGLHDDEARMIEDFAQSGHAIVAEFNTFAEPTQIAARHRLEKLFGVKWTGWAARFFPELEDTMSVPVWARRQWEIHYGEPWKFKGPGWLYAHEDSRLFVLEEPSEANPMALKIKDLVDDPITDGLYTDVPFYFWYDVNEIPKDEQGKPVSEVLANYHLDLTQKGKAELRRFGLPLVFPAIIRASREPMRLYLAGDFSDLKPPEAPYFIWGYPWFKRLGRFSEHYRDQTAFYWQFYVSLMQNIMDQKPPMGRPMPLQDRGAPTPVVEGEGPVMPAADKATLVAGSTEGNTP